MKRFLAVCLAALAVRWMSVSASAGEYGLRLGKMAYSCASPFVVEYTVTDGNGNPVFSGGDFAEVYRLTAEGDETVSIPAYSADAAANIREWDTFQRMDLEDAEAFSVSDAGKIRAVALNGYPHRNVAAIQSSANAWLQSHGLPEIRELQSGEAILATQLSIWQITNAGHITAESYLSGWEDMQSSGWRGYLKKVAETDTAYQQVTEHTAWNVEGLCQYFSSLAPAEPGVETVSGATLENPVYMDEPCEDGTYSITVMVEIETTVGPDDALTLSAFCGGEKTSQPVTESGTYTVQFSGMAERAEVKLELSGVQHGGDVYLFEGDGARLVGFDDSVLPVKGELIVEPDCVLNIFKSTEDGLPLSNIRFDLYRAGEMVTELSEQEWEQFRKPQNLVTILTTDVHGRASFDFTAAGQPEGVYLVTERENGAVKETTAPFLLKIPGRAADGETAYTLNVHPTGTPETAPGISLYVGEIGCESGSFDFGQTHDWILQGDVPTGLATAERYEMRLIADSRLEIPEDPEVSVLTQNGRKKVMTQKDHYLLSQSGNEITVSLTPAGMAYGAADGGQTIQVLFQGKIQEDAALGTAISGEGHLDYLNSAGIAYEQESQSAEVHTGGIHLRVTDGTGNGLPGAVFQIARPEEAGELILTNMDGETVNAKVVMEVTTDENGTAAASGLAYGTYFLVQTKTAEGFTPLRRPLAFTVNASSHLTAADGRVDAAGTVVDNTISVINVESILPNTGDMSRAALTVAGSCLIGLVSVIFLEMGFRAWKRRTRG